MHASIFVSDKGFIDVYPMQHKSLFMDVLLLLRKEIGIPYKLVVDPSGGKSPSSVKNSCKQVILTPCILEEFTQWDNRVELYIEQLKEVICKDLPTSNPPLFFGMNVLIMETLLIN